MCDDHGICAGIYYNLYTAPVVNMKQNWKIIFHNTQEICHIVLMTASYHSNDYFLLDLRPNDFHGVNASLYYNHQRVGRLQFFDYYLYSSNRT